MANYPYGQDSKQLFATFKAYARGGAFPLDYTSVFNTKTELDEYINEAGSYSYAGQIVAVANGSIDAENGKKEYDVYVIRSDKSTQKLGTNKSFDSVTLANEFLSLNTTVSFAGEVFTVLNGTKYELYTVNSDSKGITRMSFDVGDVPEQEASFAGIRVDGTLVEADTVSDTVEFVAGDNVVLTADADADTITIASNHPTITAGTDTTENVNLTDGGTFNAVTAVTKDANGHITETKTTTYTVPPSNKALNDITDVTLTDAEDKDVLVYETDSWVNKSFAEAGLVTPEDLTKAFATNDALQYKGVVAGSDASPGGFTVAAEKGYTYKVTTAGYVNGVKVEVGDMFICNTDSTVAADADNYATVMANWDVIQTNIEGYVLGPETSQAERIATFADGSGKLIKDSGFTIGTSVPAGAVFTDTTYTQFTETDAGLVPGSGGGTSAFLCADGNWVVPPNTTYNVFDTTAAGLVPQADVDTAKLLTAGGTWVAPYAHPTFTAANAGFYKVTVDEQGHVVATQEVTKEDITALDIPAQDTTYEVATVSTNGLMAAGDKTKLDGIEANANNYTHPAHTEAVRGFYKVTVDNQGHVSGTEAITQDDITALGIATDYVFSGGDAGLVPALVNGDATMYLRSDGQWVTPPNNTYDVMTGATDTQTGTSGLVPAPSQGDQLKFLRADGTWVVPTDTNTTYNVFNATTNGLVPAPVADVGTDGLLHANGTWSYTAPTVVITDNSDTIATTKFVDAAINSVLAANNAMLYKGTIDGVATSPGAFTPAANTGDTYKISTAGYVNGVKVEVGDMLICCVDNTVAASSTNYATVMGNWNAVQVNVDGVVIGPEVSVGDHVAIFDGSTGKVVKDSGFTIAASVPANAKFTDTTYGVFSVDGMGLVPQAEAGDTKFLRTDGQWVVPTDTTYAEFKGSTAGLVPTATDADSLKFLRADGTWVVPTDTTYNVFDTTADGLVPKPTADDANKVLTGDGTWKEMMVVGDTDPGETLAIGGIWFDTKERDLV